MTALDPQVFEKAADLIREKGWWRKGMPDTLGGGTCISNAVKTMAPLDNGIHQNTLLAHFGFQDEDLEEIFILNDSQPEETGQEWAISNLREVARKIREGEL